MSATQTGAGPDQRTLRVAGAAETWGWVRRHLRRMPRTLTLSALLIGVLAAAASVVPIWALGALVDRVGNGEDPGVLAGWAAVILGAALVAAIANGISTYLVSRLGETLLADLREEAVAHALAIETRTLEEAGSGDLTARISEDVNTVARAATEVLPKVTAAFFLTAIALVAMAGLDWRLALAGLASAPLYLLGLRWYLGVSGRIYAAERQASSVRSQTLVESLGARQTVAAYGLEGERMEQIRGATARSRDLNVTVIRLYGRFVGAANAAEFVGLSVVLVAGFWLVQSGSVTVGQATTAALLFHRLFDPIGMLLFSFDDIQAAGAGLGRLVGVIGIPDPDARPDTEPTSKPAVDHAVTAVPAVPDERAPDGRAGAELHLDAVGYAYLPDQPVLHDVTLRVRAGERVALVGSTGAGKTTLAALAAHLLPPTHGRVLLEGRDAREFTEEQWRRRVAIVTQETHVFAGTLAEDLRLVAPEATDAQLRAALTSVGASWAEDLPQGLDTPVGETGHPLSPAAAQQIALARLVLRDPAVAILDEATAEAGSAGARDLERAALRATEGRTTVVVAHRLTQAATADRVVVMEHGRILEDGPHAELLAAGGRYADLWAAWTARGH